MSDKDSNFDIEAQRPLLIRTNTSPRRILSQVILLYHSSAIFASGIDIRDEGSAALPAQQPLSSTNSSTIISNINTKDDGDQYSENIAVADNNSPAATTDHQDASNALADQENSHQENVDQLQRSLENIEAASNIHSAPMINCHNAFELQYSQMENMAKIVKEKKLDSFHDFGGVEGAADAFGSDLKNGLCGEHSTCQQYIEETEFQNQVPAEPRFITFLVDSCNNCSTILLSLAAVLSITFGMIEEGPLFGWIDGVIIIITIIVLVTFSSSRRYYLELKFHKYSTKQDFLKDQREMVVHVIREGQEQQINLYDLLAGDIVSLKRGYQVPADGLFIDCGNKALEVMEDGSRSVICEQNPFLFYGSRVIHGSGTMITTSVGRNTMWCELMRQASGTGDQKKSKLEAQLEKFTDCTHIISLLITILIFIASFLRFAIRRLHDGNGYKADSKGEPVALKMIVNTIEKIITEPRSTARTLTTLLSISLVGIMEGISFVISIAITLWNNVTLKDHKATGRDILACVKMASITCICTDKIGGLTEHHAEIFKLLVGDEFVDETFMLSQQVLEALSEGIFSKSVLKSHDSCSSLEESLLSWANDIFGLRSTNLEHSRSISQGTEQDNSEDLSGILLERNGNNGKEMRLHCNGTVNQILPKCSHYYDTKGQLKKLDSQKKQAFKHANEDMVANEFTPIAFACKTTHEQKLEATNDFILVGLLGLKNVSQEATKQTITRVLKEGGVKTILVSADDVSALERIALTYEMLNGNSDHLVLKGEDFRNLTETERIEKIDRICVLGNCQPSDKLLLVQCLREKGNIVAVAGWQRNDAPALKEADIGLAMGTWSAGEARENSDIIIRDGSFILLVNMIECVKCAYGKLQKFIQVQVIMITSSSLINFIGIIFVGDAPMTTIQLFGLSLVMSFIDGMALLMGPLTGKPVSTTEPLITKAMTRNVVAQALYQIIILATLQQKGHEIIGITQESIRFMIFNSFILCQFFNLFNARELQEKNFYRGIHCDYWFWVAVVVYGSLHVVFVVIEHRLDRSTSLNWKLWVVSLLIGIFSWLVDLVGKCTVQFSKIDCFIEVSCLGTTHTLSNLHHPLIHQRRIRRLCAFQLER